MLNSSAEPREREVFPLLILRGIVFFPGLVLPVLVGRNFTISAVKYAGERFGDRILLVAQKNPAKEEVEAEDVYQVGVVGRIVHKGVKGDGKYQVLVEGIGRFVLERVFYEDECWFGEGRFEEAEPENTVEEEALFRSVKSSYARLRKIVPLPFVEVMFTPFDPQDKVAESYLIMSQLPLPFPVKQEFLNKSTLMERLRFLNEILEREIAVARMERRIQSQVREQISEHQRISFLKEQLKAIRRELGEVDPLESEIEELRERAKAKGLPEHVAAVVEREIRRLETLPYVSPETAVVRNYLDWLLSLPWNERKGGKIDIRKVKRILDEDHYSLEEVKERILEYLIVKKRGKNTGEILCLIGPPGVGKTSLGKSIARALGRDYVRVSLGGIRDEAEIRGHRRTYVGALPGRIIQGMKRAGSKNPVFLLDEIDKIGADFRGDPSAALLEVLDPEQNSQFSDHYLEVPFDLSEVLFITTGNVTHTIPPPLLDRMEVIHIPGYTFQEKYRIARDHLIPKIFDKYGIEEGELRITPAAVKKVISFYTHEAGVRNLERELASLTRKSLKRAEERGEEGTVVVRSSDVEELLGPHKVKRFNYFIKKPLVGVAVGLAWTERGGELLPIEATVMRGKGNLKLTGNLGDVLRESATMVLSYIRANAEKYGLDLDWEEIDVHVHLPEAAIPKDGPSAGSALAVSMLSALKSLPPKRVVAITGEMTLRGLVLPVGGVREKVLAAYRNGIKEVFLPRANEDDLQKLPKEVRERTNFRLVERAEDVLFSLFESGGA